MGAETETKAVRELREGAGTQFDPTIVEVFIQDVLPQIGQRQARAA